MAKGISNFSVMVQPSDGVVTLCSFVAGDAPVLCQADFDPEHRRRFDLPVDFEPSLQHSLEVIARLERERIAGIRFAFAVREVASAILVGGCELRPRGSGTANLSYWTYPEHRRRGIATRAVALACKVAFTEMGFLRLEALIDPDNNGSQRVAIHNGFRQVGMRDGRVLYIADAH